MPLNLVPVFRCLSLQGFQMLESELRAKNAVISRQCKPMIITGVIFTFTQILVGIPAGETSL